MCNRKPANSLDKISFNTNHPDVWCQTKLGHLLVCSFSFFHVQLLFHVYVILVY